MTDHFGFLIARTDGRAHPTTIDTTLDWTRRHARTAPHRTAHPALGADPLARAPAAPTPTHTAHAPAGAQEKKPRTHQTSMLASAGEGLQVTTERTVTLGLVGEA